HAAAAEHLAVEARIAEIQQQCRPALGRVLAASAVALLLDVLPGAPILTVGGASSLIERSYQATNEAMTRLEKGGVVRQITVGRRNRAFEAKAVVDAFVGLEEELGNPSAKSF